MTALNRVGGGLRALAPHLKEVGVRVHHNANSPKRVEVIVPAGAVLDVPEQVADQLAAADPHFQIQPAEPVEAEPTPAKKAATPRAKPSGKTE